MSGYQGKIFKNRDHYRDKEQDIAILEAELIALFSDNNKGTVHSARYLKTAALSVFTKINYAEW